MSTHKTPRLLFIAVTLAFPFASLGCDGPAQQATGGGGAGGGGSSATTSTTVSQGGSGGSGGSGGTGGEAAGGGNQGGSGGTGGATGGGGQGGTGGAAPLTCETLGGGAVFGTFGATTVNESWMLLSGAGLTDPFYVQRDFAGRAYDYYRGPEATDPFNPPPGQVPIDFGFLVAPTPGGIPGQAICFGSGIRDVGVFGQSFESSKATLLGACPGTPVTGDVTFCGGNCPPVTGDIEGKIPGTAFFYTSVVRPGGNYVHAQSSEIFARAYTSTDIEPGTPTSGDMESALIFTFPEGQFGGAVYCAGPGSTYDLFSSPDVSTVLHFQNLSKLGTCTADSGSDTMLACR